MRLMDIWVNFRAGALILAALMMFFGHSEVKAFTHPVEIEIIPIEVPDNRPVDDNGNPLS